MYPEIAEYPEKFESSEKLPSGMDIGGGTIEKIVAEDIKITKILSYVSLKYYFTDICKYGGIDYYRVTDEDIDEWQEWEELLRRVYAPDLAETYLGVQTLVNIDGKTYCDGDSLVFKFTDSFTYGIVSSESQLDAGTNETVADYVVVRVKNVPADPHANFTRVQDYILVRVPGFDWKIESVTATPAGELSVAVPSVFDLEATREALALETL